MTDRPIIFSAPMVRALLAGHKTMTRRIIKPQPEMFDVDGAPAPVTLTHIEGDPWPRVTIGRVITRHEVRFMPGVRLWVREAWRAPIHLDAARPVDLPGDVAIFREADGVAPDGFGRLRASFHMRRQDSRCTLAVERVKVERLQHISDKDAQAEGIVEDEGSEPDIWYVPDAAAAGWKVEMADRPSKVFQSLWTALHGAGAWQANPYVVATSFAVHRCNIDMMQETACAAT